MSRVPGWAWFALALLIIAAAAWWITGDPRPAGGAVAAGVAVEWARRARKLRAEAAEVDDGPELDEAEREGIDAMRNRWTNGSGL